MGERESETERKIEKREIDRERERHTHTHNRFEMRIRTSPCCVISQDNLVLYYIRSTSVPSFLRQANLVV